MIAAGIVLAVATGYWLFGRAHTPPIVDANGVALPDSIATLERISLGGVDQWLVIRGHDTRNPVLLFLSGGPGASELGRFRRFSASLEERFTTVVWEQRGCGKSYPAGNPKDQLTLDRYVADVAELAEYLNDRFGQDKIYLLGHSWGTIPGIRAARERPDLFHAYVGAAQMVDVLETDRVVYRELLDFAVTTGDTRLQNRLTELGEPPYFGPRPVMAYKDVLSRAYATFEAPHVENDAFRNDGDLFALMLRSPEYTLLDKINFVRGMIDTFNVVYPQLQDLDLRQEPLEFDVPIYLVLGRRDSNATPWLAEEYFSMLEAPRKRLWTFERAGHEMLWEEPERFHELMVETVLRETWPEGGTVRIARDDLAAGRSAQNEGE